MIFALRVWRRYLYDICPDVAKRVEYKTKEMDKTHQRLLLYYRIPFWKGECGSKCF
jgi:hypothetical protein